MLVLFVLCVALWFFHGFSMVFPLFVVLLLYLTGSVWHCNHPVEEARAGCFVFVWFVACLITFMFCMPFLLVGYIL